MNVYTLNTLADEYLDWCIENNMPQMSADELLVEETVAKTEEQKQYLANFIRRWDSAWAN